MLPLSNLDLIKKRNVLPGGPLLLTLFSWKET